MDAKERCESNKNPHIKEMTEDVLYHLGLSTKKDDLKEMFGDVKVGFQKYLFFLEIKYFFSLSAWEEHRTGWNLLRGTCCRKSTIKSQPELH